MAINSITVERSLMYVQQHHINHFLTVGERMEKFWYIIKKGRVITTEDDAWNMAFNVWILLLPDDYQIIQSVEKSIYYASNFLIFDELKKDSNFQTLKRRSNGNEELSFISACLLARCLATWSLNDVMKKNNLTDIIERIDKRIYHDSHIGSEREIEIYLQDQALFTKAAVKELRTTDSFKERIKNCCQEAYQLYLNNYVNLTK